MNHREGYRITETDDNTYRFPISAKPYHHAKGKLKGSPDHHNLLTTALTSRVGRVPTELLQRCGAAVPMTDSITGVCPLASDPIRGRRGHLRVPRRTRRDELRKRHRPDSLVLEYLDVKRRRMSASRIAGSIQIPVTAFKTVEVAFPCSSSLRRRLQTRDASEVRESVIVFGDPKDMRDSINYGTRMNRHLHSVPFAKLRDLITYKVARDGVSSDDVVPAYTSQRCSSCGFTHESNRREKRVQMPDRAVSNLNQNPTQKFSTRLQTKFTLKQAKIIVAAGGGSGVQRTVWGRHLRRQALAPDQSMRLGWSRERLSGAST